MIRNSDLKLLPSQVEWLSEHASHKPYAMFPKHPDEITSGLEVVTFDDLAIAVNRASWWLENNLYECEKIFDYSGPADIRWSVFLIASIKTARTMIHVPSWFCFDDVLTSFREYECPLLLHGKNMSHEPTFEHPSSHSEHASSAFRSIEIPTLVDILSRTDPLPAQFKYVETWNEAADKPVAIFFPSDASDPVVWSNRKIAAWCELLEIAETDPLVLVPDMIGRTVFSTFSPASMDGQSFQLFIPLFFGCTVLAAHPAQKLDAELVRRTMVSASCDGIAGQAGMLSDCVQYPRTLALLRSLETIVVGGAYNPDKFSDLLRRPGAKVQNIYCQNRAFPCVQKRELPFDPRYVSFHDASGAVFQPDPSGYMELMFEPNGNSKDHQSRSMANSGSNRFATGDLFSKHPTIPDYWMLVGRTDNRINLAQGEAIRVDKMECIIGTHLLIKSALIFGESRKKPLLILEPWSDAMISLMDGRYKHKFLEVVWPFVEEANKTCSEAGQLCQELTIVLNTPVVRDFNHSVDRKRTVTMLRDKIDEIYRVYEAVVKEDHTNMVSNTKIVTNGILGNLQRLQVFREMPRMR